MQSRRASGNRAILPSGSKKSLAECEKVGRHQDIFCLVAGVPCQDWSVAGKREGITGQRSGLVYQFARILQELRPAWFVFENVPGLLSSNKGRDFAEVQRVLMVECGYGICWRVLDSQFFGVAQRRRRLFVVGSLGRPCPAEVLFESSSGEGDSATSSETRSDIAAPLTSGSGVTSNAPGRRHEDDFNLVSRALGCPTSTGRNDPNGENFVVATGINGSGLRGRQPGSAATYAIQDVRGRRDNRQNGIGISDEGLSYSLTKVDRHAVAMPNTLDQERSGIELDAALEMDGANQRTGNDGAAPDSNGMRDFAGLPEGLDSARYRALGNAVTVQVAEWIAKRLISYASREKT